MGTGLYFAGAMRRLAEAGIPAFVLAGNHDTASVLTRTLPWPDTVRIFDHRRPQSFTLSELGVVLHGRSFPTQHVHEDLASACPHAAPAAFNIGVLHTALEGAVGHASYAPCIAAALRAKGYDYWALGHVHDFRVEADDPLPGSAELAARLADELRPFTTGRPTPLDGEADDLCAAAAAADWPALLRAAAAALPTR